MPRELNRFIVQGEFSRPTWTREDEIEFLITNHTREWHTGKTHDHENIFRCRAYGEICRKVRKYRQGDKVVCEGRLRITKRDDGLVYYEIIVSQIYTVGFAAA